MQDFSEIKNFNIAFSALTLLFGCQKEHPACKYWVMRCWCGSVGSEVQIAYGPADATVSCLI